MAKAQVYLGVDVGASGLKVVELVNDGGRARLATYGYSETAPLELDEILKNPGDYGKRLAALCKEAGVSANRAITGLPMASVFTTLLAFPKMPDKQLEEQIKNKTQKLAPIPAEDLVLDWKKVEMGQKEDELKISVTAASKKMINSYIALFKSAGLQLASLETESFALIRSLLGKDKSLSFIIDIGALKTNILVAKQGVPVIHRSIKSGGDDITKLLAARMRVEEDRAEEIKRSLSLEKMAGAQAVVEEISKPIVNEVKYCQGIYSEQYGSETIEKIILTGGAAMVAGLSDALARATGLRVFMGDPWARIIYPDDLRPLLDKIGARFSVAIGLALRDIL